MATATENYDSRSSISEKKESQHTRTYSIKDADDYDTAITALDSAAPSSVTVDSVVLSDRVLDVDPIGDGSVWWKGTAEYRSPNSQQSKSSSAPSTPTDAARLSFDYGSETVRITEAIEQFDKVSASPTVATHNRINETKDGVEGVDVTSPYGVYEETHTYAAATITSSWHATRLRLIGNVNSATYGPYAAGEMRLDSIRGEPRADGDWDITWTWAIRPNNASFKAGGQTFAKKGWEYVWVLWEDIPSTSGRISREATGVFLAQVYYETDFNAIV